MRVVCGVIVLLLVSSFAWGAPKTAPPKGKLTVKAPSVAPALKLTVNGEPSPVLACLSGTTPLVAAGAAVAMMDAGAKIEAAGTQRLFQRRQAIVRITLGAKVMYVDGQRVALTVAPMLSKGVTYVPGAVLQSLFPDYHLLLVYDARTRTASLSHQPKVERAPLPRGLGPSTPAPAVTPGTAIPMARPAPVTPTPAPAATPPTVPGACAPTGGAEGVAAQEFGKPGAKLEIVACLPITHGCHVRTEEEVKKAYRAHPNDIHLVIYDLFGPEGQKYVREHGGQRAVVFVNGKSEFQYNGRRVLLEKPEGGTYQVTDIVPIIENELAAAKGS